MRKFIFVILLCFIGTLQYSNSKTTASEIEWVSYEHAIKIQEMTNKKIFMFVYTDWCDFCNYTKETLLKYQPFVDAINDQFIPVRFNAEQTGVVDFKGHELGIQDESGYHLLPIILMDGYMEFPGFIFLNEDLQVISKQGGVKEDVIDFTDYANYIGSDSYKKVKWLDYKPKR